MKLDDCSTPAVLLGCFGHGGLGAVRSLGRLGVPVHCVDADRWVPAFFSKYCRSRSVWDLANAPAAETVKFLLELGKRIGAVAVLIASSDLGAMLLSEHAAELAEWFIFPAQSTGLLGALCSKREMYFTARRCGVATPETAFPTSIKEVDDYLDTARFPVLLKPIYSRLPGQPPMSIKILHNARALRDAYAALSTAQRTNVMLQEYIPGPDHMTWTFNGYFVRGECRLAFTGRKLRNWPAYFGQGSLAECVDNEVVRGTTIRFMQALGYSGALDLGYRFDARDGRYKVNDVNPRLGAMFRLFVGENGIDVVRALYADLTGQPYAASPAATGRKWIVEDHDLFAALRYWRDGNLTPRAWLNSLRGIRERTYLDTDDPLPLAGAAIRDARQAFRRARAAPRRAAGGTGSAPILTQRN